MNISQTLHPLENSPLANAKGAGCGLGYFHEKRRRQRISQEVTCLHLRSGPRIQACPRPVSKPSPLPGSCQAGWASGSKFGQALGQLLGEGLGGGGAKADSGTPAGENRDSPKGHGLPSLAAGAKGLLLTMLALKAYRCQLPAWDARTPGQPPLLSPLHAHRPWGGVGGLPGWGGPAFNHSLAGLLSALSRVPDDGPRGKNSARVPSLPHVGFCFCGTQINTHTC